MSRKVSPASRNFFLAMYIEAPLRMDLMRSSDLGYSAWMRSRVRTPSSVRPAESKLTPASNRALSAMSTSRKSRASCRYFWAAAAWSPDLALVSACLKMVEARAFLISAHCLSDGQSLVLQHRELLLGQVVLAVFEQALGQGAADQDVVLVVGEVLRPGAVRLGMASLYCLAS